MIRYSIKQQIKTLIIIQFTATNRGQEIRIFQKTTEIISKSWPKNWPLSFSYEKTNKQLRFETLQVSSVPKAKFIQVATSNHTKQHSLVNHDLSDSTFVLPVILVNNFVNITARN